MITLENFAEMMPELPNIPAKLDYKRTSQLAQDLFVIAKLNFKRNGFFVEFGATDGFQLSNTHLLEKEFGWRGILAEPAKCFHEALSKNRGPFCKDAIWNKTGETVIFKETTLPALSTITGFSECDMHERKQAGIYEVNTISLNDLLTKYNAPEQIDYLSIDTEGSEFEILNAFDFSKHKFNIITCEHNFTDNRDKIFNLLTGNGYMRVMKEFTEFDDWYVGGSCLPL